MYFLWKRTPHGSIRVSYDGMAGFIQSFLPRRSQFRSFALAEGETASMTLVLSSRDGGLESTVENRLQVVMKPLGIAPSIIWCSRGSPEEEWSELCSSLFLNPWAWMLLVSAVALVVIAGWAGFFWTFFWGTAAWFLVKGAVSLVSRFRQRALTVLPDERR